MNLITTRGWYHDGAKGPAIDSIFLPRILAGLTACMLSVVAVSAESVRVVGSKMGSRFEITAIHPHRAEAEAAIDAAYAEIDRIEEMISSWRDDSQTSEINRAAGLRPVPVSEELFNLIRRSLKVSELTGGAFDITFDTVGNLWDFKAVNPQVPDPEQVRSNLLITGFQKIVLDDEAHSVFLTTKGTRIGFGAIGKGYAANNAAIVLKKMGITGGVVNAGGDLVIFGLQEDGEPWRIGVADPLDRDRVFAHLDLSEQALVTSGDYESFFEVDGKHYSHIIDPRTGYPVEDLRSVTILCPNAELADALATAVSVMGRDDGLELVNRLNGIEAMLVDSTGAVHYSDNLQAMMIGVRDEVGS